MDEHLCIYYALFADELFNLSFDEEDCDEE